MRLRKSKMHTDRQNMIGRIDLLKSRQKPADAAEIPSMHMAACSILAGRCSPLAMAAANSSTGMCKKIELCICTASTANVQQPVNSIAASSLLKFSFEKQSCTAASRQRSIRGSDKRKA